MDDDGNHGKIGFCTHNHSCKCLTFGSLCFAVGSLIGTMTGAFIGHATESGFFRGAAVGAISGAVFSIEVFESSLLLWQSDESGVWSLLYMVITESL